MTAHVLLFGATSLLATLAGLIWLAWHSVPS